MHQIFLALFERFCTKTILPPFKNINHKYTTNQPVLAFPQKQTVVRACMWQDKHMCSTNVSCSEKENTHYHRPCSVCLLTSNKGIKKTIVAKKNSPGLAFALMAIWKKTSFSTAPSMLVGIGPKNGTEQQQQATRHGCKMLRLLTAVD